jgi:hypothetical protein
MYQGVKVPVAFYKVVAVVDDSKGQLAVTTFQMDQSNVMPPQPGAPMPRAPFDPGRFAMDQLTLSELEERSASILGSSRISMSWQRSQCENPSCLALDCVST